MTKQILTIGVALASDTVINEDFASRASLLDWDIILFRPEIDSFISYGDQYKGKPSLSDSTSFQVKEACEHWRREIKQALDSGRTVIVLFPPVTEVYIDTGNRTYSGTGRNRATTRLVELYSNYNCLPISLDPTNSDGSTMKLGARGAEMLASYWAEFAAYSAYRVLIGAEDLQATIVTRNGDRVVGTIIRRKTSAGSLVCLPDIDFYRDDFLEDSEEQGKGASDEPGWTEAARQFAARFVSSIVALDAALRSEGQITPEPAWATQPAFSLEPELALKAQLLAIEGELERVQRRKEEVEQSLKEVGQLRALLYEKGKPLENAIIKGLKLMGFEASGLREGASEFDVAFASAEGRLIGEAEGKDNKAINVDKLRQLAMNIHEDLARDDVTAPAKAVLFGNAFRLMPPADRPSEAFTQKCVLAAQSSGAALIATRDLFTAAQYLSHHPDESYATACRIALLQGSGLTGLPQPPSEGRPAVTDAERDT